ncbi:MAG: polysaccharide biosynthesis/export family protein [Fibrobacterota bacterium]|nr:polysaccharide biosynthesis/export family protein [Fibrobacterota bacterium]QQS03812.1 MAG: polysaccharide biosynthesis/export family protein [Fibrobacterota bacterium]
MFLVTSVGSLFSGCALAPGMRYGETSPSDGTVDTTGTFSGLTVELRSLTPREALRSSIQFDSAKHRKVSDDLSEYRTSAYRLGKFDVLAIAVWEHPELTMPFGEYRADEAAGHTIDDSGALFFPYVGTIKAEGLTTSELRDKLSKSLSRVITNPQMNVKVMGYRSQKVYVHGAVPRPGQVAITNTPVSILDAINQSGGFQETSDQSRVELLRDGKNYILDLTENMIGNTPASKIWLRNEDILRVPLNTENKVYVLGEVRDPQAVTSVAGKLTLVHALMRSGGINPLTAEAKSIYVIRGEGASKIKVWHLSARNPLALAMADHFQLQPRDVVYVDATGLVSWNRVISLVTPTVDLLSVGAAASNNIKTVTQ